MDWKNASINQTDKPSFHKDNILVEEINRLKMYATMSDSYKCYKEVGPLLDGVIRENVTEEVTSRALNKEMRI